MAKLANYHKSKKPSFYSSLGHKVKTAMEIGSTAKGLFDIGRSIYQGASTCGPMVTNGLRTIGPMVATASLS